MSEVLELVHFAVKPEAEAIFLAERHAVLTTIQNHFSGLKAAQLVKLENGQYLDLVRWASREEALRAAQQAPQIPQVAAWFAHISKVFKMEHADLKHLMQ